jgi:hypothetical protein
MEAARTSETSVDIQLRTRQYIPVDSELHTRRRENLKSLKSGLGQDTFNVSKFRVCWDIAPCSHVEVYRRVRGAYFLQYQGDSSP